MNCTVCSEAIELTHTHSGDPGCWTGDGAVATPPDAFFARYAPVYGVVARDETREVVFSSPVLAECLAYFQTMRDNGAGYFVDALTADERGER